MAKRFSGDVRLTVSKRKGYDDEYEVKLKAPGCSPQDGVAALQDGYASLHGDEAAFDKAARQFMTICEQFDDMRGLVAKAAKNGDGYHVGRDKANRWPGGPTNLKTQRESRKWRNGRS